MMLRDAKDGIELVDRRHFIQRAKGSLADRSNLPSLTLTRTRMARSPSMSS